MMIRHRGFSFEMPLDREVLRVDQISRHLSDSKPVILKAMGVQAVSWVVRDYRTRSDGQNAGGITWRPITTSAIRTRLASRQPWKNQTNQLEALREQQAPLNESLRRKLPKGANKAANRRAIANQFMESKEGQQLRRIQKKRQSIRDKRKATIAKEHSSARIGVDTGRLINSLVYGVSELNSIRVGVKLQGTVPRASFDVAGDEIRIGSNMQYAGHFDADRPIFGPQFLDEQRKKDLDRLIEKTIEADAKRRFGGGM